MSGGREPPLRVVALKKIRKYQIPKTKYTCNTGQTRKHCQAAAARTVGASNKSRSRALEARYCASYCTTIAQAARRRRAATTGRRCDDSRRRRGADRESAATGGRRAAPRTAQRRVNGRAAIRAGGDRTPLTAVPGGGGGGNDGLAERGEALEGRSPGAGRSACFLSLLYSSQTFACWSVCSFCICIFERTARLAPARGPHRNDGRRLSRRRVAGHLPVEQRRPQPPSSC